MSLPKNFHPSLIFASKVSQIFSLWWSFESGMFLSYPQIYDYGKKVWHSEMLKRFRSNNINHSERLYKFDLWAYTIKLLRHFITLSHFRLSLIFVGKVRSLPLVCNLTWAPLRWAHNLLANIRLGWKWLHRLISFHSHCKKVYSTGPCCKNQLSRDLI
jgi:hypothetical protein